MATKKKTQQTGNGKGTVASQHVFAESVIAARDADPTHTSHYLADNAQAKRDVINAHVARLRRRFRPMLLTFILMMLTWVVLSGKFDAFHLSLGVLSSLLVSVLSSDLLFTESNARIDIIWVRFLIYVPWLVLEIVKANLWVIYLALSPKMSEHVDPQVVRFKSKLKSDLALVTFANSITLTPGTITVFVDEEGVFTVHAIDYKSAAGLPGEMEQRVAWVFGEEI